MKGWSNGVPLGNRKTVPDTFFCLRYVERNALSAGWVSRAEDWTWGGLWRPEHRLDTWLESAWPVPRPDDWIDRVNRPLSDPELRLRSEKAFAVTDHWEAQNGRKKSLTSWGFSTRSAHPVDHGSSLSSLARLAHLAKTQSDVVFQTSFSVVSVRRRFRRNDGKRRLTEFWL